MFARVLFNSKSFIRHLNTNAKQSKPLTLYGDDVSPPVRFVMMTASILGIKLDFQKINLFEAANKSDFYTKINPLQKVPALADGNDVICDSHAIALYLCRKSNDHSLYPSNIAIKAKVDQMLFFNATSLFSVDSYVFTNFFARQGQINEQKIQEWYRLLDFLEFRLKNNTWLAGDEMLLCDLCCATTVTSLQLLIPMLDRHKKVKHWIENLQQIPSYEINRQGLVRLNGFVKQIKTL